MKGILIDKNNMDGFIALEDGSIVTLPIIQIGNANTGDNVQFSSDNITLTNTIRPNSTLGNDKLIDFF
ncbi:hypothetical protein ACQPU1_15960 [Clostridium paraputrificum]|uniref:hypothetical protein n=1 Tax=Clostridium TaxID=1485 RepID=UPI003D33F3B7